MSDTAATPKPPLSTLEKGLRILEYVVRADRLVRLKDVSEAFSMDQATALRFLKTLQFAGFIQKYEELKAYSPGPKLAELHQPKPTLEMLVARIKPYLVELATITGQSAHLGVLEGDKAIFAGVAPSPGRVVVKQAVGDLEPLYVSAVGKTLFAYQSEADRKKLGREIQFTKRTANTITDFSALELEAEQIRATELAFDNKEGSEDVCCIACPIFFSNGKIAFSVGISMVAGLLDKPVTEQVDLIRSVTAIAAKINALGIAE